MDAKSTLPLTRQRGEGRSRFWGKPLSILAPLGEGPTPASRTGGFQPAVPACRLAPAGPERGHGGSHPRRRPDPHRRGDARSQVPAGCDQQRRPHAQHQRAGLTSSSRCRSFSPSAWSSARWSAPISGACQSGRSAMPACSIWSRGEIRPSWQQLAARGLVVGGRWWHPPR